MLIERQRFDAWSGTSQYTHSRQGTPESFEFGPFRLDAKAEILFRGDEPVALGRRPVAVLRVLLERQGAPVLKDTLIDLVWSGVAVEENNLTVQISALRRALAREPGAEKWIQTLPWRGYRFVGPITRTEQPGGDSDQFRLKAAG